MNKPTLREVSASGVAATGPEAPPDMPASGATATLIPEIDAKFNARYQFAVCYDKEHAKPDRDQTSTREAIEQ